MTNPDWSVLDLPRMLLAEGPSWNPATSSLSVVGIEDQLIVIDGLTLELGDTVGCCAPWADGSWIAGCGLQIIPIVSGSGRLSALDPIATILGDPQTHRINDGKVDPSGRLWVGVVGREPEVHRGSLWCVDPDGSTRCTLDDVGLANGLGWSPEGDRMWFTDSKAGTITGYRIDLPTGALGPIEVQIQISSALGEPDGLCIDRAGNIWTAIWNGWQIQRYDSDGVFIEALSLPVPRPTCPTFAGDNLDQLIVTSASTGLSADELIAAPLSGHTFSLMGVGPGLPAHHFGASPPEF